MATPVLNQDPLAMAQDIQDLKTSVKGMQEDIKLLQSDVKDMRTDIMYVNESLAKLFGIEDVADNIDHDALCRNPVVLVCTYVYLCMYCDVAEPMRILCVCV